MKEKNIQSDTLTKTANTDGLGYTPSLISSTYGEGWGLVTINTSLWLTHSEDGETISTEPIKGNYKFTLKILSILICTIAKRYFVMEILL